MRAYFTIPFIGLVTIPFIGLVACGGLLGDPDPASSSLQPTADAGSDAASTAEPPAPPVACTQTPRVISRRELGESVHRPTVNAVDDRHAIVSWIDDLDRNFVAVLDVVDDTLSAPTEVELVVGQPYVYAIAPGALAFQWLGGTMIYASGRWSPMFSGSAVGPADDGRIILDTGRWYDPKTGSLTPEITLPFDSSRTVRPLPGGRMLAVSTASGVLNVGVYDGKKWTTKYLTGKLSYVTAGDDFVVYQTDVVASGAMSPLSARRLRLDRMEEGFGPMEVVSADDAGDALTVLSRSGEKPAAGLVAEGSAIHFVGAVTHCETCSAKVVDRVLGPDGWSAPTLLGLDGASVGDMFLDGTIVRDGARQQVIAFAGGKWSRPIDLALPVLAPTGLTMGVRNGLLVVDAQWDGLTSQWVGALRLDSGAPKVSWVAADATLSMSSHRTLNVLPDIDGGFIGVASLRGTVSFTRFTSAPAIATSRTTTDATLHWWSTGSHAGIFVTRREEPSLPVELVIDAWNDRGTADRTAILPQGDELAIAAIRCGALVAHRRAIDHVLELTRWSGE